MTFPLAVCAEVLWRDRPIDWRASRLKGMGFGVGLWNWPAHDLPAPEPTGATFRHHERVSGGAAGRCRWGREVLSEELGLPRGRVGH
jgi:hydroxypyruvate isomerase